MIRSGTGCIISVALLEVFDTETSAEGNWFYAEIVWVKVEENAMIRNS